MPLQMPQNTTTAAGYMVAKIQYGYDICCKEKHQTKGGIQPR